MPLNPYNLVIVYPALLFTATAQNSPVVALGNLANSGASVGGSWSTGTLTVTGTGLATATLAVMGSADGGLTFFALPISALAGSGAAATSITVTAAGMYQVPLAGITHIQISTSGTFTATNVSVLLTLTP